MDFNGNPIQEGGAGGGDIVANSICVAEVKVSKDACQTVEYILPTDAPTADGQYITGNQDGSTSWIDANSFSNVQQRKILFEDDGLSGFNETTDVVQNFNNRFNIIQNQSQPEYDGLTVCIGKNFRCLSYATEPALTPPFPQWERASMAGGQNPTEPVYNHLWKDFDTGSFNDTEFEEFSVDVWMAATQGSAPTYTINVYIDVVDAPLGPPPVFGQQYVPAGLPVLTGFSDPTLTQFSFKLNPATVCQRDRIRVVFECVSELGGQPATNYQDNKRGQVFTNCRISGLFTSPNNGNVIPPALIDHNVLINAVGRKDHDVIDTHIDTFEPLVTANGVAITNLQNDVSNIQNDVTDLQNDKVNKAGDTMTGSLDMSGNNLEQVQILSLGSLGIIEFGSPQITLSESAIEIILLSSLKPIRLFGNGQTKIQGSGGVQIWAIGGFIEAIGNMELSGNLQLQATREVTWDGKPNQYMRDSATRLDIQGQDELQLTALNGFAALTSITGNANLTALGGGCTVSGNGLVSIQSTTSNVQLFPNNGTGGTVRIAGNIQVAESGAPLAETYFLPRTRLGSSDGDVLTLNATTGEMEFKAQSAVLPQPLDTTDSPTFVNIDIDGILQGTDLGILGTNFVDITATNNLLLKSTNGQVRMTKDVKIRGDGPDTKSLLFETDTTLEGWKLQLDTDANGKEFSIQDELGANYIRLNKGQAVEVNDGANSFKLPTTRPIGEDFVIASSDALGNTEWRLRNDVKEYGELYFFGNATTTTFTNQVDFIKIGATYLNGLNVAWAQGAGGDLGRLQYSGNGGLFKIDVRLSVQKVGGANDYEFAMTQNATVIDKTRMNINVASAVGVEPTSVSMSCLLNVATADFIDVRVRNADNTEAITVINMNFNITPI